MKITRLFALLILFVFYNINQAKTQEIKIGEALPDVFLTNILGKANTKLRLKDLYKDKLLIIDFWATWCVPCVKEMRFLDSLKGIYPNHFNAVMVTRENKTVVDQFFQKPYNRDITNKNLVVTTSDTLLNRFFPHRGIPHNIWVDKNGIVRAITGESAVTEKNIIGFKHGVTLTGWRVKKEIAFNPTGARFNAGDTSFSYRSIITPAIAGIYVGFDMYVPDKYGTKRYFMCNNTLLHAYWAAYSKFNAHLRQHLIEVHTKDSLKFFQPTGKHTHLLQGSKYADYDAWKEENHYFYDLSLPKGVSDSIFRDYMFNDLERQFNVHAKIEQRNVRCTVVSRKQGSRNPPLAKTLESSVINQLPGYKFHLQNVNITDITSYLYRDFGKTAEVVPDPFIIADEFDNSLRYTFDLDLTKEINSSPDKRITAERIYKELEAYGFQFKTETRSYPILVLYDLN